MNRVVHFEIAANDPEVLATFYREVFDWKIEPWGPPEFGYMHITTGDADSPGIDGGMWKVAGNQTSAGSRPNAFNCTIEVTDIDAIIQKIKNAGGQITRDKYQIPGVGWLAMCLDPDGNNFGIVQH